MGTFHVISKEKKEQILNRIKNDDVSVPQAAKDSGISDATIYIWLGRTGQGKNNNTEVLRLKRELQVTYEIIGVAISRFHNQNLVMEGFMDAVSKTNTHPCYLHSDQGSEYTSDDYKTYVASKKITISFTDKASPWQNEFQKSFYGKFKVDIGYLEQFESLGELIEGIYQSLYYYNNKQRHTSLNMSPAQFRLNYYIKKEDLKRLSE